MIRYAHELNELNKLVILHSHAVKIKYSLLKRRKTSTEEGTV